MMKYKPYKSDKPGKKYYIITNDNKKVYFGQAGASDMTKQEALKAKKKLKENSLPPALSTRSNDRLLRSNK